MNISKYLIAMVIFLAVILRFINLDSIPPHLSNDEIGASYAAYSISKTFRDGNNNFLPILWVSPGGYGSPLAIYIPLISISLLGNQDYAVRLPSAILGSLTIIFIGLLIYELSNNKSLGLIGSLVLAISPWHFSASHWALESNYALFFIVTGLYLFFYGYNRHKNLAILASAFTLTLSIYSYYTEWVLTPLIIIAIALIYRRSIFRQKIYLIVFILIGVLLLPLFFDFLRTLQTSRASSEFITKDIGIGKLLSEYSSPIQQIQIVTKAILDKYSAYNSLDYLFFYGIKMLPKDNPYEFGFFLSPFVIPFVLGLIKIKNYFPKHSLFIYSLLLTTPFVASLTEGELNNWRSLPQLLPVCIITASGTLFLWDYLKNKLFLRYLWLGTIFISVFYFLPIYFIHFPIEKAEGYQYGYRQISNYLNQHYSEYTKIIIDPRFGNQGFYYQGIPSLYIPFYTYLDPSKAQESVSLPYGVAFDKYEFREINWNAEQVQLDYLYIVPANNIPNPSYMLTQIHHINLPNHITAFKFYTLTNNTQTVP